MLSANITVRPAVLYYSSLAILYVVLFAFNLFVYSYSSTSAGIIATDMVINTSAIYCFLTDWYRLWLETTINN